MRRSFPSFESEHDAEIVSQGSEKYNPTQVEIAFAPRLLKKICPLTSGALSSPDDEIAKFGSAGDADDVDDFPRTQSLRLPEVMLPARFGESSSGTVTQKSLQGDAEKPECAATAQQDTPTYVPTLSLQYPLASRKGERELDDVVSPDLISMNESTPRGGPRSTCPEDETRSDSPVLIRPSIIPPIRILVDEDEESDLEENSGRNSYIPSMVNTRRRTDEQTICIEATMPQESDVDAVVSDDWPAVASPSFRLARTLESAGIAEPKCQSPNEQVVMNHYNVAVEESLYLPAKQPLSPGTDELCRHLAKVAKGTGSPKRRRDSLEKGRTGPKRASFPTISPTVDQSSELSGQFRNRRTEEREGATTTSSSSSRESERIHQAKRIEEHSQEPKSLLRSMTQLRSVPNRTIQSVPKQEKKQSSKSKAAPRQPLRQAPMLSFVSKSAKVTQPKWLHQLPKTSKE